MSACPQNIWNHISGCMCVPLVSAPASAPARSSAFGSYNDTVVREPVPASDAWSALSHPDMHPAVERVDHAVNDTDAFGNEITTELVRIPANTLHDGHDETWLVYDNSAGDAAPATFATEAEARAEYATRVKDAAENMAQWREENTQAFSMDEVVDRPASNPARWAHRSEHDIPDEAVVEVDNAYYEAFSGHLINAAGEDFEVTATHDAISVVPLHTGADVDELVNEAHEEAAWRAQEVFDYQEQQAAALADY